MKTNTSTYSFVVNFRGGTYCSQVSARDLTDALKAWLSKFMADKNEIKYFSDAMIPQLQKGLFEKDFPPVQLSGLKNIWFAHCLTKQGQITMNIILTQN